MNNINWDVTIIDFEDSFTYNIVNVLQNLNLSVKVIPFSVLTTFGLYISQSKKRHVVIYGPGPGHLIEYQELFPTIRLLLQQDHLFNMGICLGHQIIWYLKGKKLVRCVPPKHGEQVEIIIPPWEKYFSKDLYGKNMLVQRYNSWMIVEPNRQFKNDNNELYQTLTDGVMMGQFENGISYQFHPESVGTSCPEIFFRCAFHFLYNNTMYERLSPSFRGNL